MGTMVSRRHADVPHPGNEAHPVLRGVTDVFGPTDVYGIRSLPDDSTILLDGAVLTGMDSERPTRRRAEERSHAPGGLDSRTGDARRIGIQRILVTTMGTAEDFSSHDLRTTDAQRRHMVHG